ncbi:MAG TPA: 3-deoxy-7-phosphoheptulonate synthase, partial [Candidatus Latescibacteria bacterium]|nr:3-deoxy-7-phosphoheptulonate synthase [Candidatus Latescibacterota bacterium]
MLRPTDDLRIAELRPLIPPAILMEELPVTEQASITVSGTRAKIRDCIEGRDDRLVVVAGPCSIHD